jgi:predicted aspartyl protease
MIGPGGTIIRDALVDTGADDTVLEEVEAARLGIDLSAAAIYSAGGIGDSAYAVRYAQVTVRLTDGVEYREWPACVGFTPARLKRPLLGFAGFLQFFTATFHGDREQVELTVNPLYPGR